MKKIFEGKKINGEKVLGKVLVGVEVLAAASHTTCIAGSIDTLKDLKNANISKSKKTVLSLIHLGLIGYSVLSIKNTLNTIDKINEELDKMDYIEER